MRSRALIVLFLAAAAAACSSHATSSPIIVPPIAPQVVASPTATPGWSSFTYSGEISVMASGHDGGMWASLVDGRVTRLDPLGDQTFYTLGGTAAPHDGISSPLITANPDGNMYVYEQLRSGYGIAQVTPAGIVTDFALPGTDSLQSMTTGCDGAIWMIRGYTAHYVARMDTSGNYTAYENTLGPNIQNIIRGADKNLWGRGFISNQSGLVRISVVDGTMTWFPDGAGLFTLGSEGLFWWDTVQGDGNFIFQSADMEGNITGSYPVRVAVYPPQVPTAHLLWWIKTDKLFAFNTTSHKVTKRVTYPIPNGNGDPLVVGPDKRLWSARDDGVGGTMYLYTFK